jgi:uncharacterized membrane protein
VSKERKSVREMLGEVFRDIGLLWVTFAVLDALFQEEPRWDVMKIMLIAGFCMVLAGIVLERLRGSEGSQ